MYMVLFYVYIEVFDGKFGPNNITAYVISIDVVEFLNRVFGGGAVSHPSVFFNVSLYAHCIKVFRNIIPQERC